MSHIAGFPGILPPSTNLVIVTAMADRTATIKRDTNETQIEVSINLDGNGDSEFDTGVPFLEHMMDQIARHGMIDLAV